MFINKMPKKQINKEDKPTRYFTVHSSSIGVEGGRYTGTPGGAAKKAANAFFKEHSKVNKITLTIRETTKGSKKKELTYTATRKKLDTPVVVKRGNATFKVTQEVKVMKCK